LHKPPTFRFGIGQPPTASALATARSGIANARQNAVRKNEERVGTFFALSSAKKA